MSFGAPFFLYALLLLPVLVVVFFTNESRAKLLLQKIVAARLMPQLAGNISHGKRLLRFSLLLLGLASIIVSLAQPQIGYTWEQSKRKGRDVLIAIDTSKSMLATDLAPNRLARAKLAAQDLIGLLQGDRVGVLAFAGASFLQAPLTIDYGAVLDSIQELDTNIIPRGGTDIADVIESAAKAFGKGESENRALVLLTDGDELDADGVTAARKYAKDFRIFTVGLGSPEGAIIPVPGDDGGTSFIKDQEGQIVKTKLDETRLRQIADAAGGFYTRLQNGPADMKRIVQDGLGKMQERDIDARLSRRPIERYQWPLGLGLALVAASMLIGEKRRASSIAGNRVATSIALFLLASWLGSQPSNAAALNKGLDLYNAQKYKEAYGLFQNQLAENPDSQALHFDSGAAAYKTGDYDKAIDAFSKAIASPKDAIRGKSEYNLGNALCLRGAKQESKDAKLKDWNNALQHYDEALKIDPKNEDAKFNREAVRKLIEELKKEPPKQDKQEQNKDQQKDSKKDQDKDQKQDQKNQQDQQKKDDQKKDDKNSGKDQQKQNSGSKDEKKDGSQGGKDSQKDQPKQDSKNGEDKKDSSQNQEGKDGEKKDSQSQGDEKKQDADKQNQQSQNGNGSQEKQQPSGQPTPAPGEDKKFSGDIKDQSSQKPGDEQKAEQAEPYVPGQERAMSADEAQRVIEAEKDEDAKGVLIERKGSAPVLKDW